MREPEKVERLRSSFPALRTVRRCEPPELQQARLLRVHFQSERSEPLPDRLHESLRIAAVLKPQDEIIGVPHEIRLAPDLPRPPFPREPTVQHVVQVHVRQQRRYHRPLRRPPHHVDL